MCVIKASRLMRVSVLFLTTAGEQEEINEAIASVNGGDAQRPNTAARSVASTEAATNGESYESKIVKCIICLEHDSLLVASMFVVTSFC